MRKLRDDRDRETDNKKKQKISHTITAQVSRERKREYHDALKNIYKGNDKETERVISVICSVLAQDQQKKLKKSLE